MGFHKRHIGNDQVIDIFRLKDYTNLDIDPNNGYDFVG
jgi:hypothetical protein